MSKSGRIGVVQGSADKANAPLGSSEGAARLPDYHSQKNADATAFQLPKMLKLIAALWLAAVPLTAQADDVCMPAAELEAALIDWYGEEPADEGPSDTVLWRSATGSTWTVVRYFQDGTACAIDSGVGGYAKEQYGATVKIARLEE